MKKLSLYVFLVLMFCNVGFAKPVLLECQKVKVTDSMIGVNELDDDVDNYEYFSLDLKNNEFYSKGWGEKTKGTCSLGSCEKYSVWEGYGVKGYELPYRKESAEHLYLGREWKEDRKVFDFYTFRKTDLGLIHFSNLITWLDGTVIEEQAFFECKEINKFPF